MLCLVPVEQTRSSRLRHCGPLAWLVPSKQPILFVRSSCLNMRTTSVLYVPCVGVSLAPLSLWRSRGVDVVAATQTCCVARCLLCCCTSMLGGVQLCRSLTYGGCGYQIGLLSVWIYSQHSRSLEDGYVKLDARTSALRNSFIVISGLCTPHAGAFLGGPRLCLMLLSCLGACVFTREWDPAGGRGLAGCGRASRRCSGWSPACHKSGSFCGNGGHACVCGTVHAYVGRAG